MKKIVFILGLLLMTSGIGHAAGCGNYQCPANPYSDTLGLSNLTGINFLSEKIGNALIKKAIKKDSEGKYKVNLQSYNVSSLKKGIFKSLEINGKNTVTDGIYASVVNLNTVCDYNYVEVNNKQNTVIFREPLIMAYNFKLSEEDLNKTMENSKYNSMIRQINSIGNTYKLFNISSNSVKIENNKLYYILKVSMPLLKAKPDIVIQTDMSVRNGEIVLSEAKLITNAFSIDMKKLEKVINYLNPLEFSLGIFENKEATTKVDEIIINDNMINISGMLVINKDIVIDQ